MTPDGERREETLTDYAYQRQFGVGPALPDYFVTAQNLVPGDHMVLQGTIWKFIDSSISKTIDVLEDNSFDAFAAVFMQAYDMSCKGCTTYCPNDITGAALRPLAETPTAPGTSLTSIWIRAASFI